MSFPKYPKYKDSGVEWLGDVPEHWKVSPLKRLAEFINGNAFKPTEWAESGIPIVRIQNLNGSEEFNYIDGEVDERYLVHDGDLLFGWSGNRGTSFGPFLWRRSEVCALNQHIFRVVPYVECSNFLYWSLKAVTTHVEDQAHGIIGMVHVTKGDLGAINVPVPPLPEQTAIATFLDAETSKIDALIAEQRRLIELLNEKRQAVISHAVTKGLNPNAPMKPSGIEWLGDVPVHWEVGPLKRFWDVVDCKHVTVPFFEEGYPVASVMEVRTFELDLSRALRTDEENYKLLIGGDRQPQQGDVIYCRNTANTGTSAYVGTDEPICIGQDVVLIKSRQQNGRFLNYILHGEAMAGQLSQYMVGSTFKRINVADIRELIVTCPPKDEQEDIVKIIDPQGGKFDALIGEATLAIDLLQERRTALISAAVTGKIDVCGFADLEAR
jgi:type I restriction enzyme S subunit